MRVYKVGHIFTDQGEAYANTLRQVLSINRDPGPPVPMEMTERQWAALQPTAVHVGDPPAAPAAAPPSLPRPSVAYWQHERPYVAPPCPVHHRWLWTSRLHSKWLEFRMRLGVWISGMESE